MSTEWQVIARRKQEQRHARIPEAWLLPAGVDGDAGDADPLPSTAPRVPPTSRGQGQHTQLLNDVRKIPAASRILSDKELAITDNFDATALAEELRRGALTAEEVTVAFCKRAAIAQQVCNCLTEIFFDDAIKRAQWLDAERQRTGTTVGPLHGVPVSLKDTFLVQGYDSSLGIASLAFQPATQNGTLVDILRAAGAVLYCKTNVPQTMMALDSDNNVFGRTLNPRNPAVTAGGSSGGEGALIAMRGSILGVGTDIGGSIRIPAMCNGLYGIKPSVGRVPYIGQQGLDAPGESSVGVLASAGPLATSLRDCELLLKTVAAARPWMRDPKVVYGGWESQGDLVSSSPAQKLHIGILYTDDLITPLPPIRKVLEETNQALLDAGHTTCVVSHPELRKCQSLANSMFGPAGGNYAMDLLEKTGEPLIKWLSTRTSRKPPVSLQKIQQLTYLREEMQRSLLSLWYDPNDGREFDAIVCPVAPHPTPPLDRWNGVSYTSSFVLLDYPAGTLPVRDIREDDLHGDVDEKVLSSWDKANKELWNPAKIDRKVYLNTTLCVQVLAPRLQERRLVQAMEVVDKAIKASNKIVRAKI